MSKQYTQEELIKIAAETGAKAGIEAYREEQKRICKIKKDARLYNVEKLMRHYRGLKLFVPNAIATLEEAQKEDFGFFKMIMENGEDKIDVNTIIRSKALSAIMITHIESMLNALATICLNSKNPVEVRQYRVLEARYILEPPYSVAEIAQKEGIDTRTVYRDIDEMCAKLSSLLFGIQGVVE